jgi:hypothetical protein
MCVYEDDRTEWVVMGDSEAYDRIEKDMKHRFRFRFRDELARRHLLVIDRSDHSIRFLGR